MKNIKNLKLSSAVKLYFWINAQARCKRLLTLYVIIFMLVQRERDWPKDIKNIGG